MERLWQCSQFLDILLYRTGRGDSALQIAQRPAGESASQAAAGIAEQSNPLVDQLPTGRELIGGWVADPF
eukprot:gene10417-biopygen18297